MRKPTKEELRLLQSDVIALEKYCSGKSLITDIFKQRFEDIQIQIGEIDEAKGASGKANSTDRTVSIKPDKMQDDKERRNVLYHEIGHLLFGLGSFSDDARKEFLKRMLQIKNSNKELATVDTMQYISGLKLLEEYIVEKFAIYASHTTLNRKIEMETNCRYVVSGNYNFNATFSGGYGVFESLCDELLGKAYGNFDTILSSCLESTFYKDLFEKYDEVELMKILGKFGYVYDSIKMFAKDRTIRSTTQTQEALEDLSQMIPKIKLKTAHRTHLNKVTPGNIAQVTSHSIQENPGAISEGFRKSKGLFSRIFNKNKESQKRKNY